MDLSNIMGVLNSPNGLKKMMLQPAFQNDDDHEFSQADLIADVVNIERMDLKKMALAINERDDCPDVDITAKKMTPERAAELLQGIAKGNDLGLIEVFDQLEDQRMTLLAALTDDEQTDSYVETKQEWLYTTPDPEEDQ